jgi:uncharacterized protein
MSRTKYPILQPSIRRSIMELEKAREYVNTFFESHDPIVTGLENRYPFRRRYDHCLRCSVWAKRIAIAEGADVELTEISALFHDVGKSTSKEEEHGEVGAQICDDYLKSIGYDDDRRRTIVKIVRDHSQHARNSNALLEEKIVSDADILDEVGAITVLWDAMACATRDEAPSYDKAYDRIENALTDLRNKLSGSSLHTLTARSILEDRLLFLEYFLKNLGSELGRNKWP